MKTTQSLTINGLTIHQHRIAKLAAEGLTNKQIAERTGIPVHTVGDALTVVFRVLGVSGRLALAVMDARGEL